MPRVAEESWKIAERSMDYPGEDRPEILPSEQESCRCSDNEGPEHYCEEDKIVPGSR